jgi:hypothetical protein
VNTKQVVIATLMVGGLAIWLFGGEDKHAPPAETPALQAPRPQAPVVPSRPPLAEPQYDYGITGAPSDQAPYPDRRLRSAPRESWGENPYQTDSWADTRGYQFRPLNEGDRRRMGSRETTPWRPAPPQTTTPGAYGPRGESSYGSHSPAPWEGTSGRYEAPYGAPAWGPEPDYAEQWDLPSWREPAPSPQRSRDPPARRMLPSLDWSADRTITAR